MYKELEWGIIDPLEKLEINLENYFLIPKDKLLVISCVWPGFQFDLHKNCVGQTEIVWPAPISPIHKWKSFMIKIHGNKNYYTQQICIFVISTHLTFSWNILITYLIYVYLI